MINEYIYWPRPRKSFKITQKMVTWARGTLDEISTIPKEERPYHNIEIRKLVSLCHYIISQSETDK